MAQNATVTLSGLTISNGDGVASVSSVAPWGRYGGGIFNHGTLTLSGCTVSGNAAYYEGGGIFSDGTVTVGNSSSITGNKATLADALGADVYNLGVLYLDSTSTIGILDGNPANPNWGRQRRTPFTALQNGFVNRSTWTNNQDLAKPRSGVDFNGESWPGSQAAKSP